MKQLLGLKCVNTEVFGLRNSWFGVWFGGLGRERLSGKWTCAEVSWRGDDRYGEDVNLLYCLQLGCQAGQ